MKERLVEGGGAGYTIKIQEVNVKTVKVALNNVIWKITGQCEFVGSAEGYDWISQKKDYVGDFELEVYQNELVSYFKKYYPDISIDTITQISNKLNYDFDYSIDDIREVIGASWSHVEWNGRLVLEHAAFDIDNYSGDFVIFDKGRDGDDDINDCSFVIECKEFATDVESAYQSRYDNDKEDYMRESKYRKMTMTLGQIKKLVKENKDDYDKMDHGLDDYWESFNPDEIQWEPYDGHKLVSGAIYLVSFKDKDDGLGVYAFRFDPREKLTWQSDLNILGQEVE